MLNIVKKMLYKNLGWSPDTYIGNKIHSPKGQKPDGSTMAHKETRWFQIYEGWAYTMHPVNRNSAKSQRNVLPSQICNASDHSNGGSLDAP